MFSTEMKETKNSEVVLNNFSPEPFKTTIQYLYVCSTEIESNQVFDVYCIADLILLNDVLIILILQF